VSTGFIWLSTQTFRWHHCTGLSDALRPWYWNSYTYSFFHNLNSAALHYYGLYCIDPSEQCCAAAVASGGHNAETNQRWFVISFVATRSEILRRIPTVKTARTLRLCCVFSNCMEHSAAWYVLIDQAMYNLLSLTKQAGSGSRSDCLPLVTTVTYFNTTVLDLGFGSCLSNSNTLFLLILQFRLFNTRVDFNIIFPSDQSSTFFNKYLTLNVPNSHPFPPTLLNYWYSTVSYANWGVICIYFFNYFACIHKRIQFLLISHRFNC
jgi:hypothetical protein